MNISELAKGVATSTGSNEADAKKAITAVFDQIADAAAKGDEVSPGASGAQSGDRRGHDDRGVEEGVLHCR
jgi:DNA-binding protein HU-beta